MFVIILGSLQLDGCRSYLNVRLQGTKYAGRLEVCYRPSQWRNHFWMPVCDDNWSNVDAGVVCRQLNFTNPAYQDHKACGRRCFGDTLCSSRNDFVDIRCINHSISHIRNCSHMRTSCYGYAGVFCNISPSTIIKTPPLPQYTPTIIKESLSTSSTSNEYSSSKADNKNAKRVSSALGGTLGSVIAVMAIILMSVVFGWVWFFIRKKDSRIVVQYNDDQLANPTYEKNANPANLTFSSIQNLNIDAKSSQEFRHTHNHIYNEQSEEMDYEIPLDKGQYNLSPMNAERPDGVIHQLTEIKEKNMEQNVQYN